MALWGYNFNREVKWQKNRKGFGFFYLSAMFIFPSLIYYLFGNPAVSNFYLKNKRATIKQNENYLLLIYTNSNRPTSVIIFLISFLTIGPGSI
ncbi:uncharacterized protein TA17340 [Theileria annulata]|uniref:Uncharacterized protein n=1 Tax=Theileria annulata TaxID=5874 RepID=Q4UAM9_THEAN|nr:uncharacterized protein TA17340 [Theileria annulata]CAI76122.1 hypothetical protein TA17340 [Theileria annulata]|eukprot:XP_952748.1 hypothetical protein TA17340 [Theileria annulata]